MTITVQRFVPTIPDPKERIKVIIDTDAANEIDDLYAIALAIRSPKRFLIEGFVATHFAASRGPEGIDMSCAVIHELMEEAGVKGRYPVMKGGDPMRYPGAPSQSSGAEFIIDKARQSSPSEPLWVIGLGAATNLATAVLLAPDILPLVRYVFHARCEYLWPERTVQYNICGDIIAAKTLLESRVPLVWFDTGTHICASYETTREKLAGLGRLGKYLHEYRDRNAYFRQEGKGFFDLGDIAYLIKPDVCKSEIVPAPALTRWMYFDQDAQNGEMLRVYDINAQETWEILYDRLDERGQ